MKKPLIVIAGPTATGKTSLAVGLAKKINGEIISADSMQVYKYMNIGTAKASKEEQEGIVHHLLDIIEPDDQFNSFVFQEKAKKAIEEITNKNKIPIIVGGTGFYIQSIVYDIQFEDVKIDQEFRDELQNIAHEKGNEMLHKMLEEVDPESFHKIHPNNVKRVIRALEFYKQTNGPISAHNKTEKEKISPYNLLFYVLNMDRNILYNRIDSRVDQMFEKGLVAEVESLMEMGYKKDLVSMQGLGYKEIIAFLEGKYDLDTAKYILKRDTRHFAKRQLTWFRREKNIKWIEIDQFDFNIEKIRSKIIKDIEVIRNM